MKKLVMFAIVSLTFVFYSINASAVTRAVSCHSCSSAQMSSKAAAIAGPSLTTVYVFNQTAKDAKKYKVYTSSEDGPPFVITKEAYPVPVEQDIKVGYRNFINAANASGSNPIVLPPNFAVHSSAGALLAPNHAYGHISRYLGGLNDGWMLMLKNLIIKAAAKNIPKLDLSALTPSATTLPLQFPDGSTMDFKIEFTFDLISNDISVSPIAMPGTATDQDGEPIPERASHFAGRSFHNNGGGLQDWVEWAASRGVVIVTGSGSSGDAVGISCAGEGVCTYVFF